MDSSHFQRNLLNNLNHPPSLGTTLASGVVVIYVVHQLLIYFDVPILSPHELIWNALVYILPKRLLLDRDRRQELKAGGTLSQTQAAKSEALRKMLGVGGNNLLQNLPGEGLMRRASMFSRQPTTDAPPGLGNWDNSCYQNSVLQGLASLDSMKEFLKKLEGKGQDTSESLLETVNKLNDTSNNGKQLWTPAKLKNMSSWQQQDAQEYFSKIVDELDKESAKSMAASTIKPGLEIIAEEKTNDVPESEKAPSMNPLDGLLAQRVACTRCGYSEGLSMIPFNCLTVPLGSRPAYHLEECLDDYAGLEEISDVECSKCTVVNAERQLKQMLPAAPEVQEEDGTPPVDSKTLSLPPEIRAQAFKRLRAMQQALEEDDFSDKTINESCEISKKGRVSSTKTRQAVVGRPPQSLVVHVNRSVFDEMTGSQRKNYASVQYPMVLNLRDWMLSEGAGSDGAGQVRATESILSKHGGEEETADQVRYRVKALVTHYGRHENGHYICYRRHPKLARPASKAKTENDEAVDADADGEAEDSGVDDEVPSNEGGELQWWRLSDEDVSPVSEQEVLAQGGVFMLFYEREDTPAITAVDEEFTAPAAVMDLNADPAAVLKEEGKPSNDEGAPHCNESAVEESESATAEEQAMAASLLSETMPVPQATDARAESVSEAGTTSSSEAHIEGKDHFGQAESAATMPPTPPLMRTARGPGRQRQASRGSKDGKSLGGMGMRAVAAT